LHHFSARTLAFFYTGIMPDDAVKAEVEELQKRLKTKTHVPVNQMVDYSFVKEALTEMKR